MSVDCGRNMERRNDTEERDVRNRNLEPRRNHSPQKRYFNCRYVEADRVQHQERSNLNYRRKGGLSPLRSPLRPENKEEVSHSASNNDRRHIRPRYNSRNERKMKTPEKTAPFSPRSDRYTPESGSMKVHDWSEEMDREDRDEDEENRYRRKLEMDRQRKNSVGETTKREEDPTLLARRQKDIDYGKNTQGYSRYLKIVPSFKRRKGDPSTPLKFAVVSRRSWDQQVKNWRRRLHRYDPPKEKKQELDTSFDTAFNELSSDCESWDSCSTASETALADYNIPLSSTEENRLASNATELSPSHTMTTCKTFTNGNNKRSFQETGFPPLPSHLGHREASQKNTLDPDAAAQSEMKKSFISYAEAAITSSAPPNNKPVTEESMSTDNMDDGDCVHVMASNIDDFFAEFDLDDAII